MNKFNRIGRASSFDFSCWSIFIFRFFSFLSLYFIKGISCEASNRTKHIWDCSFDLEWLSWNHNGKFIFLYIYVTLFNFFQLDLEVLDLRLLRGDQVFLWLYLLFHLLLQNQELGLELLKVFGIDVLFGHVLYHTLIRNLKNINN